MVLHGPSAKELGVLSRRLKLRASGPEPVDVAGYYSDGRRAAINGRRLDIGSLTRAENVKAYTDGYYNRKGAEL